MGLPSGDTAPPAGRAWNPTLLLAVSLGLFVFLVGLTRITNYDIWFHLAMGREILTNGLPVTDPFSFTNPNSPADLMSWLSDVVFFGAWRVGGMTALSLLKAGLPVILIAVMWRSSIPRKPVSPLVPLVAAALLVAAVFGLKFRLFLRPHLFELIFLSASFLMLDRRRWDTACILFLAGIQVLWTNMHGSFLLGFVVPALFFAGDAMGALLPGSANREGRGETLRRGAAGLGLTLAALLGATLVNPRGFKVLEAPAQLARWGSEMATLGEFQPLTMAHLTGFGFQYTWGFSLVLLCGLLGLLACLVRRSAPPPREALLFVAFLTLPLLGGVRFIAEFLVIGTPLVIRWWSRLAPVDWPPARAVVPASAVFSFALIPIWWVAIATNPLFELGIGEKSGKFPAAALRFLDENQVDGNVFNSIGFGGYMLWYSPHRKVFIDGRVPVYPRDFYRQYLDAHSDPAEWLQVQNSFDLQVVVSEYLTDLSGKERMPVLDGNPDWSLVYWDPVGKVYVKRGGPNGSVAAALGLVWARPNYDSMEHLLPLLATNLDLGPAEGEYRRLLDQNPGNSEAALGLALVLAFGEQGDPAEVLGLIDAAERARPGLPLASIVRCRALLQARDFERSGISCSDLREPVPHRDPAAGWASRETVTTLLGVLGGLTDSGVQLSLENRVPEALVLMDSARALAPWSPEVLVNRGLIYERAGDVERALADFEAAEELAPPGWESAETLRVLIRDARAALGRVP